MMLSPDPLNTQWVFSWVNIQAVAPLFCANILFIFQMICAQGSLSPPDQDLRTHVSWCVIRADTYLFPDFFIHSRFLKAWKLLNFDVSQEQSRTPHPSLCPWSAILEGDIVGGNGSSRPPSCQKRPMVICNMASCCQNAQFLLLLWCGS